MPYSFMQAARTAPYLYDAVWLYAHALNRSLSNGGNISNGTAMFRNIITTTPLFRGKTSSNSRFAGKLYSK